MDHDPYYETVAEVFPIILLVALGVLSIYGMVGVPVGLILIGVAIGMTVARYTKHHHGAPHHH